MSDQLGYGPLERVDGPRPVAPLYGLLQAAASPASGVRIIPDADGDGNERWINGGEVYPYPPDVPEAWDSCATGSDAQTKPYGTPSLGGGSPGDSPNLQFGAFPVVLGVTCKTYKVWDEDEFKARAVEAFTATEGAGVAREILTGEKLPLNPHLSDSHAQVLNSGTATSVAYGLSLLEAAIGETGKIGLVHCSPRVATVMREKFAIDSRDGILRTINGNVVINDAGYTVGATPDGQGNPGATQEWIYATGPIDVRREIKPTVLPDTAAEAIDRGTGGASVGRPNTYTYRVERIYLVTFDGFLQAAVLVDLCNDSC